MGPRQLSRGILHGLGGERLFLGASMGPRQLSRGIPSRASPRIGSTSRFNGATAIEPWNFPVDNLEPRTKAASMGPRQLSRGITITYPSMYGLACRFNGATAIEPWNYAEGNCTAAALVASMGPRQLSRGIQVVGSHTPNNPVLQWGHGN